FILLFFFFFSSRRRHTRSKRDWSSDVCSSDLSVLLAAMGGAAGCLFASWGVSLIFHLMPATYLPLGYNVHLHGMVLLFCAFITLGTGILFGVAPALQAAKTNPNDALKQGGRTGAPTAGGHGLRSVLVV